jgi:hypothetical protein
MWAKASISPLYELAREAGEAQSVGEAELYPPSKWVLPVRSSSGVGMVVISALIDKIDG